MRRLPVPSTTTKPPTTPEKSTKPSEPEKLALERLVFFSDAVFAIAITLLALEIRLPAEALKVDDAQLFAELLANWHAYLAFIISFLVIGSFWISHHRKFRYILRYDNNLLAINLLLLMTIAFMPFPSSVISENGNRTATIFYALSMIAAGLLSVAIWIYASHHNRLIDPHLDQATRRRELYLPLLSTGVFALSIGLAFFNPGLARLSWLLLLVVSFYTRR
jgi:uncharacterized membrane protein